MQPANQARILLCLADSSTFEIQEYEFFHPTPTDYYVLKLTLTVDKPLDFIGVKAKAKIWDCFGYQQSHLGIINKTICIGRQGNALKYQVFLSSFLHQLVITRHPHYFCDTPLAKIISAILSCSSFVKPEIRLNFNPNISLTPYAENNWLLLKSLAHQYGFAFYEQEGSLLVSDSHKPKPSTLDILDCHHQHALDAGVYEVSHLYQEINDAFFLYADNEKFKQKFHQRGSPQALSHHIYFDIQDEKTLNNYEQRLKQLRWLREVYFLKTNQCSLKVGARISIKSLPTLQIIACNAHCTNFGYEANLTLTPSPFSPIPKFISHYKLTINEKLSAFLDMPSEYNDEELHLAVIASEVDDQGFYQFYLLLDEKQTHFGLGKRKARLLHPLVGKNSGFHFPLPMGTRVVVTKVHTYPVILGALPSESMPSPVTSINSYENRLMTSGGSGLIFDEKKKTLILKTATKASITMGG